MTISRKTFTRSVAVVALAAALAGCSMTTSGKTVNEVLSSVAAEAPGAHEAVDQARDLEDDDEDVVQPQRSAQTELELAPEDWTHSLPLKEPNPDFALRPPSPEHLVNYLPENSALKVKDLDLEDEHLALMSTPDVDGALATAQLTFWGIVDLINNGEAGFFAKTAAATCQYCVGKLKTAYDVHDGEWDMDGPWVVRVDNNAQVGELSGPDHLSLAIEGEETMLVVTNDNQTTLTDFAGEKVFFVEMLYDQGQWWVIGVASEPR